MLLFCFLLSNAYAYQPTQWNVKTQYFFCVFEMTESEMRLVHAVWLRACVCVCAFFVFLFVLSTFWCCCILFFCCVGFSISAVCLILGVRVYGCALCVFMCCVSVCIVFIFCYALTDIYLPMSVFFLGAKHSAHILLSEKHNFHWETENLSNSWKIVLLSTKRTKFNEINRVFRWNTQSIQ